MAPSATAETHADFPLKDMYPEECHASILHGVRELRHEVRTISSPGRGELQISIRVTGICGSDVSYYQKRRNGDICCGEGDLCLGHESSGVVIGIGDEVKGFQIDDHVALEVGVPHCNSCGICRKGRYNLCKKMRFRSSAKSKPFFQGTLQEKINHPAMWCHKVPHDVSFEAAALLEPLSVAMHASNRAGLTAASTALVIGAGTVGLLTAAMALQSGCTAVTIMDVDEGRVDYALEHGFATHGYKVPRHPHQSTQMHSTSNTPSTTPSTSGASSPVTSLADSISDMEIAERLCFAKKFANDVLSVTQDTNRSDDDDEDIGVDCTFECTGKEICMQTALYATRPGGRVIMVGMGTPIQRLPMSAAHLREVDILGIFRYCNTYAAGIRLLQSGRLPNLDGMVTHRVNGLEHAREAFELASRTKDDDGRLILKVVIKY